MLLVEDDPAVRAALLGALEAAGFEALGAADATEGLEVLARRRVDVVVADYNPLKMGVEEVPGSGSALAARELPRST